MKNGNKRILSLLLTLCLALGMFAGIAPMLAFADEYDGFTPEMLTLTPGSDSTSINLTWFSGQTPDEDKSMVKFVSQTDGTIIRTVGYVEIPVVSERRTYINDDDEEEEYFVYVPSTNKYAHKATITGLEPGTTYSYSVANDGEYYSEAYTYKVQETGDFSFVAVGDPQVNSGSLYTWQSAVDAIVNRDPNIAFITSMGDQVDDWGGDVEREYEILFTPNQLRNIPLAPTMGNHDYKPHLAYHYNVPNEMQLTADEELNATMNYWFTYNDVLFVVLNNGSYEYYGDVSNSEKAVERFEATIKEAIAQNPNYKWLFVQHHRSTRSVGNHGADWDLNQLIESEFETLMEKYKVDAVLAGHDHVYARTYPLKGGEKNSKGIVYYTLNGTGGKYYDIADWAWRMPYAEKYVQTYDPGYLYVEVKNNSVTLSYYDTDRYSVTPFDTYTITKASTSSGGGGGGGGGSAITPMPTPTQTPAPNAAPKPINNQFEDVKATDWFYADVEYALENGLFDGISESEFAPEMPMTRGMLVTVLYRTLQEKPEVAYENRFLDVEDDAYYCEAVSWAAANGIVEGMWENEFVPDSPISRQDFAVILIRYSAATEKELDIPAKYAIFEDENDIKDYAKGSMQALYNIGVIKGRGGQVVDPIGQARRSEVAAMLHRFLEMIK